jgi:hypothetical protein
MVTEVTDQGVNQSTTRPVPVVGRTPYDAVSELFALLGRALPWFTVIAMFLYTTIEIGKSYQAAQAAAVKEFADRVTELNKLLQTNFSAMETLRNSQLEGLNNFSKLNASVMDSVAKHQNMLETARSELARARESQDSADLARRTSEDKLAEANRQQRLLKDQVAELQRKGWDAENLIDAATRLTTFIAERGGVHAIPLDRRSLSLRFENSRPEAISRDSEGTVFYGQYRMPGNELGGFLTYLRAQFPEFASRLTSAGGATAAIEGHEEFKSEWISLSRNREFVAAQDDYIEKSKYDPFIARLKKQLLSGKGGPSAFEPEAHSVALQAVLWSVVIQHGSSTPLVVRAFDGLDTSSADDQTLIRAIYRERRLIDRYYPNINQTTKMLLTARYQFEEELALKMLDQKGADGG